MDGQSCCRVGHACPSKNNKWVGKQKQQLQAIYGSRACASRSWRVCDTPRHPRDVLKIHAHAGADSTDKPRRVASRSTFGSNRRLVHDTSMCRANTSVTSQESPQKLTRHPGRCSPQLVMPTCVDHARGSQKVAKGACQSRAASSSDIQRRRSAQGDALLRATCSSHREVPVTHGKGVLVTHEKEGPLTQRTGVFSAANQARRKLCWAGKKKMLRLRCS